MMAGTVKKPKANVLSGVFMMILAALGQVIIFGWIIGAERGLREANRGADFRIPGWVAVGIRYVTPAFLIIVLVLWCLYNGPDRIRGMSPTFQGPAAARAVYTAAVAERFENLPEEELAAKTAGLLGVAEGVPDSVEALPDWLQAKAEEADDQRGLAESRANVARFVFLGVILMCILVFALGDIAFRNRFNLAIEKAEAEGVGLEE